MSTLHKALNIPADQSIPAERLREATYSPDGRVQALARIAKALRGKAPAPKPK
jgi:hypothetical protein